MDAPQPNLDSTRTARGARRNAAILITGAGGEMGHGLLEAFARERFNAGGDVPAIVAIDLRELSATSKGLCDESFAGDVTDSALLSRLIAQYEISEIYHLAALLSTRSEYVPETAQEVNVGGTINLLRIAVEAARSTGETVKFFFPSSIAVYGLADLEEKRSAGTVSEDSFLKPQTMYGCNKLSCENLGRYYARHYRTLASDRMRNPVDFRSIRFPGIISAETTPSGGTSDFAPEMIHAAAQGEGYSCFVRRDARIPFMTMPEAIDATRRLMRAPSDSLSRTVYNVQSFAPSAEEFLAEVKRHFPLAKVSFDPDQARQSIVDSWPESIDDSAARRDWAWEPTNDLVSAFADYLVPRIRERYDA